MNNNVSKSVHNDYDELFYIYVKKKKINDNYQIRIGTASIVLRNNSVLETLRNGTIIFLFFLTSPTPRTIPAGLEKKNSENGRFDDFR